MCDLETSRIGAAYIYDISSLMVKTFVTSRTYTFHLQRVFSSPLGCCYPSGLEKTLCKWDIYVLLVTKGLSTLSSTNMLYEAITFYNINRRKTLCVLFNAFMYLFIVEGQKVV